MHCKTTLRDKLLLLLPQSRPRHRLLLISNNMCRRRTSNSHNSNIHSNQCSHYLAMRNSPLINSNQCRHHLAMRDSRLNSNQCRHHLDMRDSCLTPTTLLQASRLTLDSPLSPTFTALQGMDHLDTYSRSLPQHPQPHEDQIKWLRAG